MNIKTTATCDREKGTLTIDMDLVGTTEMDHEILAAFFDGDKLIVLPNQLSHVVGGIGGMRPLHNGDQLHAQIVIEDDGAFDLAVHNLENRKRKADGRPSLEEVAAKESTAKAANVDAENRAAAEKDKAASKQDASTARIEERAAQIIADRAMAERAAVNKPEKKKEEVAQPQEPDKVQ